MIINLGISSVCKAFDDACVGTRVVSTKRDFVKGLITEAVSVYGMPDNGQGFIPLPGEACEAVFSGDDSREGLTAAHTIVKEWRGELMMFACRTMRGLTATFVVAIVYTREAYFADLEVDEAERARLGDVTHVLVALLGSRGPKPTLSSSRFVRNLAGGNNSFAHMGHQDLVTMAKEIVAYETAWITVADA